MSEIDGQEQVDPPGTSSWAALTEKYMIKLFGWRKEERRRILVEETIASFKAIEEFNSVWTWAANEMEDVAQILAVRTPRLLNGDNMELIVDLRERLLEIAHKTSERRTERVRRQNICLSLRVL